MAPASIANNENVLSKGQRLKWNGAPFLNGACVRSILDPPPTGILHTSRPLLPVVTQQYGTVKFIIPHLELLDCLHSNDETLVEVWTAKAGDHTLCVKFYCEYMENDDNIDWNNAESLPAKSGVAREAKAYTKLRDAQGSIVPWSYGFYKFTLGPGTILIGHVMEYLSADDGFREVDEVWDTELEYAKNGTDILCIQLILTFLEIHRLDIASLDIACRNMRVRKQGHTLYFTIFDFSNSVIISEMPPLTVWHAFEVCSLQEMLYGLGIHHNSDSSWFTTTIGAKFKLFFDMDRLKLQQNETVLVKYREIYASEPPLGRSIPRGKARLQQS